MGLQLTGSDWLGRARTGFEFFGSNWVFGFGARAAIRSVKLLQEILVLLLFVLLFFSPQPLLHPDLNRLHYPLRLPLPLLLDFQSHLHHVLGNETVNVELLLLHV
ncbi:hypothetical protein C1H46_000197 [Malus baccata]|uniref:Uncharacterized protein n=1 Tax=Malus baccata TaxID=106549 RepID=A0A540NTA8_MALBA|nr:hypothetical protein C1H46_000197 [Malus baccata]